MTMTKANIENYDKQKTAFPWSGATMYELPELSSKFLYCILLQSNIL